ncbi:o-acyltransferase wsd1 [Phtheirospermum japonicum]|uniref:O-acyltransferase wsd1 n=1 Tax=Phtheirospermum japonicum TaxID=374723 RepID=A0A830B5V2_9LAMI|nr:o-acyltransferase wsd1 [Phtheirospermum japonicum]
MRLFMNFWTTFLIIFNTLVGLLWILVTIMFLKDTKTPIKGKRGIEFSPKRFVHRIIDFDDIKLVKTAMNVTVNDVATGVAEAGLTRYLNMRYGQLSKNNAGYMEKANLLPRNLRLRSIVCFNLRSSPIIEDLGEIMEEEKKLKGKWGNIIGIALVPLTVDVQDDPLIYVRRAKATMDQKKLSLEPKCISMAHMLLTKLFGIKIAGVLTNAIFRNTTLFLSNMVGPREEISPFGHPLCYIAPTLSGFPQALVIHFQSYADKFIISIAADENLIPNPHQLCDDMVKSLKDIKDALLKRGIV